jgi:Ras-related protein Rab-14
MIIGNKMDLQGNREVTFEEAHELAQNYGLTYMECSAKTGENIDGLFLTLGRKMKEKFID